jgi:hypothetical protein
MINLNREGGPMRTWLVLTACFFLSEAAQAQQTVAEREAIAARQIRRVTETRYAYINGERSPQGTKWGYIEYDRRGNQLVTGRFTKSGLDSPMYVREYDDENRPVKRTFYAERTDANPTGKPILVFQNYRLDEHKNVAEENGYTLDGSFVVRVSIRRDATGRPLERKDDFGENSPKNRFYRYRYNANGDAIEVRTMDATRKTLDVRRTRYAYDGKGRIMQWWAYDENGTPIGGGRHRYDADGNRIETLDQTAEGKPKRSRQFTYQFWD